MSARIRSRQQGAAAVELALILLFSSFLLPVVFLFSRVFYHYNVIKQGTQDAANFVAALPRMETAVSSSLILAQARAKAMVERSITEAGIKPPEDLTVTVSCNGGTCFSTVPVQSVKVEALFRLEDAFWQDTGGWLPDFATSPSWTFTASSEAISQN
jgi:Flp pilus assembly protein TadG